MRYFPCPDSSNLVALPIPLPGPYSFVADYLMKRYAEKAEEFRGFADAARKQEESRREFCCNPTQVEMTRVSPDFNGDSWGV